MKYHRNYNRVNKIKSEYPVFARLYDELAKLKKEQNDKSKVVVCGLLKAGKSSILNALTGHLEQEHFRTNAACATTKVQAYENEQFCYIDTPGLDATEEDDAEAWDGILSADILLFVHNLRLTELDSQETAFINALLVKFPSLREHLFVVYTNSESVESEEQNKQYLQLKLTELFGFEPDCFLTSFTRYQKGKTDKKPLLIKLSGIEELKMSIQDKFEAHNVFMERRSRIMLATNALVNEIDQIISEKDNEISEIRTNKDKQLNDFLTDISALTERTKKRLYDTI